MVNEYFDLVNYGGTVYFYIFELANFSALAFLLLLSYKLNFINVNSLIVWLALFFSPLLFNYFLFSPWLFGDQFMYASEAMSPKIGGETINDAGQFLKAGSAKVDQVAFASQILRLVPLPNYMTVTSLAFVNKLMLFITFLWFKRFFKNENEVLIYFLIPSIILYSSLALRDTLIVVLSLLFVINLIRGRILLPLLLLYPIFILKIQMFVILGLYLLGHSIFQAHKSNILFGFFIIVSLVGSFIYEDEIISIINLYRIAFFSEDYISYDGIVGQSGFYLYAQDQIESLEIKSLFHAAYLAIVNLPILLLIPLPWNWTSVFYPIQAIESCLLIYLYFRLSSENNTYKKSEYILLTFILVGGLSIYALIMANEGTFVRYRFTLFYPFLLALFYISKNTEKDTKAHS
jgi:hypothetical protein